MRRSPPRLLARGTRWGFASGGGGGKRRKHGRARRRFGGGRQVASGGRTRSGSLGRRTWPLRAALCGSGAGVHPSIDGDQERCLGDKLVKEAYDLAGANKPATVPATGMKRE